jgi:HemX protein
MESTAFLLFRSFTEVMLPVQYVLTSMMYGLAFFQDNITAKWWKSKLLLTTVVLHTMYIGMYTTSNGHCLITSPFEIMSLIAYTIMICYSAIEFISKVKGTGFFLVSIAMIFAIFSAVTIRIPSDAVFNPILSNLGIGLHITAAIIGYGGIAISAVYGLLYLLMFRDLKRGSFGALYNHLPSLESLERLNGIATIMGFVFLTIAIGIGAFWLPYYFPSFSYLDPKLIMTGFVWLIYALVLAAKFIAKLNGKTVVTLTLIGFGLAIISLTIINAFSGSFHKFS